MPREQIRIAIRVADTVEEVEMVHDNILLRRVDVDSPDGVEIPEEFREFRLQVVAIGPGGLIPSPGGGYERAPMSVDIGDMVQFQGAVSEIKVGDEKMAIIRDGQVVLKVKGKTLH